MAQKHKRLSEDAAHDSAHARESEAKCAELERALQAALKREVTLTLTLALTLTLTRTRTRTLALTLTPTLTQASTSCG